MKIKKIVKTIALIASSVIGLVLCFLAILMNPTIGDEALYGKIFAFAGALLLFTPQAIIWHNKERGGVVIASIIISLSLILIVTFLL